MLTSTSPLSTKEAAQMIAFSAFATRPWITSRKPKLLRNIFKREDQNSLTATIHKLTRKDGLTPEYADTIVQELENFLKTKLSDILDIIYANNPGALIKQIEYNPQYYAGISIQNMRLTDILRGDQLYEMQQQFAQHLERRMAELNIATDAPVPETP